METDTPTHVHPLTRIRQLLGHPDDPSRPLSQEALAARGGLSRLDVQNVESGKNKATTARMQVGLSVALCISVPEVAQLLDGQLAPETVVDRMRRAPSESGPASVDVRERGEAIVRLELDGAYDEAELAAASVAAVESYDPEIDGERTPMDWADAILHEIRLARRRRQKAAALATGQVAPRPVATPSPPAPVSHLEQAIRELRSERPYSEAEIRHVAKAAVMGTHEGALSVAAWKADLIDRVEAHRQRENAIRLSITPKPSAPRNLRLVKPKKKDPT